MVLKSLNHLVQCLSIIFSTMTKILHPPREKIISTHIKKKKKALKSNVLFIYFINEVLSRVLSIIFKKSYNYSCIFIFHNNIIYQNCFYVKSKILKKLLHLL